MEPRSHVRVVIGFEAQGWSRHERSDADEHQLHELVASVAALVQESIVVLSHADYEKQCAAASTRLATDALTMDEKEVALALQRLDNDYPGQAPVAARQAFKLDSARRAAWVAAETTSVRRVEILRQAAGDYGVSVWPVDPAAEDRFFIASSRTAPIESTERFNVLRQWESRASANYNAPSAPEQAYLDLLEAARKIDPIAAAEAPSPAITFVSVQACMASPPPIDVVSIVLGAVAGVALDRIASAAEAWLRRHRSLEDLREQTREIQRFLFVAVANGP